MKSAEVLYSPDTSVFFSVSSQCPLHCKSYRSLSSGFIISVVSPSWTSGSYMLDTVLNSRKAKPWSDESDRSDRSDESDKIAERYVVKSAADMFDATRFLKSSFGYKSASLLVYIVDSKVPSMLFSHSFDSLDKKNLYEVLNKSLLALSCSSSTAFSVFFKLVPS